MATVAYGMGVNNPSVRLVVHWGVPGSVEVALNQLCCVLRKSQFFAQAYYQEAGRAGRDSLPATCLMFWSDDDFTLQHRFIQQQQQQSSAREAAEEGLSFMHKYCHSSECRRVVLLSRFGERYAQPRCGNCDVCMGGAEALSDVTEPAQVVLQALSATKDLTQATLLGVLLSKLPQNKRGKVERAGFLRCIHPLSGCGCCRDWRSWLHMAKAWCGTCRNRGGRSCWAGSWRRVGRMSWHSNWSPLLRLLLLLQDWWRCAWSRSSSNSCPLPTPCTTWVAFRGPTPSAWCWTPCPPPSALLLAPQQPRRWDHYTAPS